LLAGRRLVGTAGHIHTRIAYGSGVLLTVDSFELFSLLVLARRRYLGTPQLHEVLFGTPIGFTNAPTPKHDAHA
jgi:hypothetical protein